MMDQLTKIVKSIQAYLPTTPINVPSTKTNKCNYKYAPCRGMKHKVGDSLVLEGNVAKFPKNLTLHKEEWQCVGPVMYRAVQELIWE